MQWYVQFDVILHRFITALYCISSLLWCNKSHRFLRELPPLQLALKNYFSIFNIRNKFDFWNRTETNYQQKLTFCNIMPHVHFMRACLTYMSLHLRLADSSMRTLLLTKSLPRQERRHALSIINKDWMANLLTNWQICQYGAIFVVETFVSHPDQIIFLMFQWVIRQLHYHTGICKPVIRQSFCSKSSYICDKILNVFFLYKKHTIRYYDWYHLTVFNI